MTEQILSVFAVVAALILLSFLSVYFAMRYLVPFLFHLWIDVWPGYLGRTDPVAADRARARALARYNRGWRPLLEMWSTVAACEPEETMVDGETLIWLDYRCCDDGHGRIVNCGDLHAGRDG
jgi:hypothetical protein